MSKSAFITGLLLGLAGLACVLAGTTPALAQPESPAMPTPDRLAPPPMPTNPTQADEGAHVYWFICMACHGDRGQGLTDEWRTAFGPEDENCWQSKCHAANHPPQGFKLPRYAPPVMGAGTLARFQTAADLSHFICESMPWQAPGTLDEPECWQLTAFLYRSNGISLIDILLSLDSPTQPRSQVEPDQPPARLPADFRLHLNRAGIIAGALLLLILAYRATKVRAPT